MSQMSQRPTAMDCQNCIAKEEGQEIWTLLKVVFIQEVRRSSFLDNLQHWEEDKFHRRLSSSKLGKVDFRIFQAAVASTHSECVWNVVQKTGEHWFLFCLYCWALISWRLSCSSSSAFNYPLWLSNWSNYQPLCRYRSISGACNNLENPEWGTAGRQLVRLLPPDYEVPFYAYFQLLTMRWLFLVLVLVLAPASQKGF